MKPDSLKKPSIIAIVACTLIVVSMGVFFLTPIGASALQIWADSLFESRKYDAAVDAYSLEINLSPKNGIAHFHRGLALANLGHWDRAVADYNQALAEKRRLYARQKGDT